MPLKELIRLFLLRRVLPLEQSIELLGAVVISTLLRLRALCCLESDFHLVNPEDAVKVIEELEGKTGEKRGFKIFSAVAWWPVEDLLIATDYGDTQHAAGEFEPVMYLSLDSYALISACPRDAVENVLDMCCGSGVQGLVALRHYARQATFLDVNPRALAFSRFNAALNGLHERCSFVEGSVHEDFLRHMGAKKFEAQ
ncbi:Putative glucuronoxylan glucuronosyltransferase IRX7 [Durusdinium trenchii]|uniref:Glucuronoxylan glucuronosyltransferase IRX7 n=1 Tax=Durusdinium trenchii TaxID=1381693 RepID=A0ABP0LC60_9DINO